ncbi:MAG: nuclear transport factor 2 family protein [bacterium]
MNTKELAEDLAKMVSEGKILEAFEKYYAEDVVMQENEDAPRVGKETNRGYEKAFVEGITEFHDGKVLGVAVGEDYSTIESSMDVTHKDYGRIARSQVAVQHWKDGKVVN